jgi:hypothetical protein
MRYFDSLHRTSFSTIFSIDQAVTSPRISCERRNFLDVPSRRAKPRRLACRFLQISSAEKMFFTSAGRFPSTCAAFATRSFLYDGEIEMESVRRAADYRESQATIAGGRVLELDGNPLAAGRLPACAISATDSHLSRPALRRFRQDLNGRLPERIPFHR